MLNTVTCTTRSLAHAGLVISQQALQYGMQMLEKSGSGLKASIRTANVYERKLLNEVLLTSGCQLLAVSSPALRLPSVTHSSSF